MTRTERLRRDAGDVDALALELELEVEEWLTLAATAHFAAAREHLPGGIRRF